MLYKLSWLIAAVVSPELLVAVAFSQFLEAREIRRLWEEEIQDAEAKKWLGLPGAFFAAMGGFVVVQPLYAEPEPNPDNPPKKYVTTIRASGFCKLLEFGIINECIAQGTLGEGTFSWRHISDKGKADSVAKALLCAQIAWMCLQCLGRELDGLPVTLLEGHLLIQILFAIMAHICWWHKPLDVSEPFHLPLNMDPETLGTYICVDPRRARQHSRADFLTDEVSRGGFFRMFFRAGYDALSYHSGRFEGLTALLGVLNGGLHLIAWNSHFPTDNERLLWRISAVSAGGLFPLAMLTVWRLSVGDSIVREFLNMSLLGGNDNWNLFWRRLSTLTTDVVASNEMWAAWVSPRARLFLIILIWVGGIWYLFCMLYLTIGPFLCVRNLPKGAYAVVEWTDFLPHL
ncbi:hypothetical protein BJX65DRAFT_310283 [Aspergillus insuetus]